MKETLHYTPFQSALKDHWIESLNGGGNHEFLSFVQLYTPFKYAQRAFMQDIFHEGFLISVADHLDANYQTFFYAFPKNAKTPIEYFSDLYMGFLAKRENIVNINHHRQFTVLQKRTLTSSFVRVRLHYNDLAINIKPAFITSLDIGDALPRAYTYRRINSDDKYIEIDFFTHGETPTLHWLNQLTSGKKVISQRERNESIEHLTQGKALLCGDETAFPAIAAILEHWKNPVPPIVLLEMRNTADVSYFDDCVMPAGTEIHTFAIDTVDNYGSEIKTFLEERRIPIEKVWGAFNTFGMKRLREFLEKTYYLTVENMVLRVYWNANKKR